MIGAFISILPTQLKAPQGVSNNVIIIIIIIIIIFVDGRIYINLSESTQRAAGRLQSVCNNNIVLIGAFISIFPNIIIIVLVNAFISIFLNKFKAPQGVSGVSATTWLLLLSLSLLLLFLYS